MTARIKANRCPDCARIVVQERAVLRGRGIATGWWWCHPCGKRVVPIYK